MKSDLPKVLHPVAGLPMVGHVVNCARLSGADHVAVVVGHGAAQVEEFLGGEGSAVSFHLQEKQLGTANAVNAARAAIDQGFDDIIVMFGDTPLVETQTLTEARKCLAQGADLVVIGFRPENPTGYGRLLEKDGKLVAIREEKEASADEKKVTFCNGGLMAFSGQSLASLLDRIGNNNAKGEFYLTDAVEIANSDGLVVKAIEAPVENVLGVNTRVELAEAEAIWQTRRRRQAMLDGVSMIAPESVYFHHDTVIEAGVALEPNIFFGPGVKIEAGATIRAFSHLEGAQVGAGAEIGPFARLRPGADLGPKTKVGNFCEVKKSKVGEGAKVNHLTYIGDAIIGAGSNIGAGTITCNYDGMNKHLTDIGENAFIGSNSSLVAPVKIGNGAYIASGSVITQDVPDDAVGFGRAHQTNKPGLAVRLRERIAAIKAAKKK